MGYSTIFSLIIGLLGITYSVLSASWDPEVEGSKIGLEEFKSNIDSLKNGLQRSRENLIAREKMKSLSNEEIDRAINALNKKETKRANNMISLEEKIKRELE